MLFLILIDSLWWDYQIFFFLSKEEIRNNENELTCDFRGKLAGELTENENQKLRLVKQKGIYLWLHW